MGKKQILTSLPEGDYEDYTPESNDLGKGKIIKDLPDGDYETVEVKRQMPHMDVFDPTPKNDNQLENTLNDIVATSSKSISDDEREYLKETLRNPNLTPEQAKEAVSTIQGYSPKWGENGTGTYYWKTDKNGVLMPKALAPGERPPKGYDVASVWGTERSAKDDAFYTDIAKTVANGALGAAEGVFALAQQGAMAIADTEIEYLNKLRNTADALKFEKDPDLNRQIYNTEGIEKISDAFDAGRFDLSLESIWGNLNMLGESIVSMAGGANAATGLLKAGKLGSTFVGSYLTQISDNIDANKDAGLSDRDASALSLFETSAMAALDLLGPTPNIVSGSLSKAKKELVKKLASKLEVEGSGMITKESFKKLAKELPTEYVKMASSFGKEFVKDTSTEILAEGGQEFVRRASEQLWDKLSDSEKAKFGTDVTSAESFGAYIQNMSAAAIGAGPMSVASTNFKQKYREQSSNAMSVVKDGKVSEFKANVDAAVKNGEMTPEQAGQAKFKIDAYNKYWEQTKDLPNLDGKEKKEVFELSFNIEALKSEIPSKDDLAQMDPIAQSKVRVKEDLIKGLQKELDKILLRQDVQTETKVGQKNVDDVYKDIKPKEGDEKPKTLNQLLKELGEIKGTKPKGKVDVNPNNGRVPISEITTPDWNDPNKTTSLRKKQLMQEELKNLPNNEMAIDLQEGQYGVIIGVLEGNKKINLAQSAKANVEGAVDYIKRENLPEVAEETVDDAGRPLKKYKGKVMAKRVEIDARDLETDEVITDEDGNPKRKAVISIYNPETGGHIGFQRELDPYKGKFVSSKYSPTEEAELKAISEANHLTEQINPYKYKPVTQKQTAAKPTKVSTADIEGFAERIIAGDDLTSADDQQFYQNNKKAIEKYLYKRAQIRTKTKEAEPEVKVKRPEIKLNFITDAKALNAKVDIVKRLKDSDKTIKSKSTVQSEQNKIKKKFESLEKLLDCIHG